MTAMGYWLFVIGYWENEINRVYDSKTDRNKRRL